MFIRALIVAALFHGVASAIWVGGFACGMTAFGTGGLVGFGKLLFIVHSLLFLPVFILDAFGLPLIDTAHIPHLTFVIFGLIEILNFR